MNKISDIAVKNEIKFILLTMPDNSIWQISANIIATARAKNLAYHDCGDENKECWQEIFDKEYAITLRNSYELYDYAINEMSWTELNAIMIKSPPPPLPADYEEWYNKDDASWNYE